MGATGGAPRAHERRSAPRARLAVRLSLTFAAATVVVATFLFGSLYRGVVGKLRADFRARLEDAVAVAALQVDGDAHASVRGRGDEAGPAYARLRDTLRAVRTRLGNVRYVYTVRRDVDGALQFVVDAEEDPDLVSHAGDPVKRPDGIMSGRHEDVTRAASLEEFWTDDWGTWLTAYAPVLRSDGSFEALLGMDVDARHVVATERRFFAWALGVFAASVGLSVALGLVLGGRLARPIGALRGAAEALAQGDLSHPMPSGGDDELGDLSRAFDRMVANLRQVLGEVHGAVGAVDGAVDGILSAVESQVRSLGGQSTSAAQVVAAAEGAASVAGRIAGHAERVHELASADLKRLRGGSAAIASVVAAMEEVSACDREEGAELRSLAEHAKEVGRVVELVETIASRTKLIAFNAALEASSAGQEGARFGVVAQAIRELADTIVESVGFISGRMDQIRTSVRQLSKASRKSTEGIASGVQLARQAAEAMAEVAKAAEATNEAALQITLFTHEQSEGHQQIVSSVREVAEGAREASEALERVRTSTAALKERSRRLAALVAGFDRSQG